MRVIAQLCAVLAVVLVGCTSAPAVTPGQSAETGVPEAFIDAPVTGTNIAVGQALQVNARGVDTTGVTRLDLRVGDVLVDSATTPAGLPQATFSALLEWTPSAEGTVTISALAYRANGTGSLPTSIQVIVGTTTGIASPTVGLPTTAPTSGPSADPSAAPEPTAEPTQPPATPQPTAPPVEMNLEVSQVDLPAEWQAGVETKVVVYIRNHHGRRDAPRRATIEVFAAGATVTRRLGDKQVGPEGVEHYTIAITPRRAGPDRSLRVTVLLPAGFVDPKPGNNVWRSSINVAGPATPPPTEPPAATPTATP